MLQSTDLGQLKVKVVLVQVRRLTYLCSILGCGIRIAPALLRIRRAGMLSLRCVSAPGCCSPAARPGPVPCATDGRQQP